MGTVAAGVDVVVAAVSKMEDIQPDATYLIVATACGEQVVIAEVKNEDPELTQMTKDLKVEDPDDYLG